MERRKHGTRSSRATHPIDMSGAVNVVEILATSFLLALIGTLAYVTARECWIKRSSLHSLYSNAHRTRPASAATHRR
jgi:hypothetical protein